MSTVKTKMALQIRLRTYTYEQNGRVKAGLEQDAARATGLTLEKLRALRAGFKATGPYGWAKAEN